jgi:hypothetical protein
MSISHLLIIIDCHLRERLPLRSFIVQFLFQHFVSSSLFDKMQAGPPANTRMLRSSKQGSSRPVLSAANQAKPTSTLLLSPSPFFFLFIFI